MQLRNFNKLFLELLALDMNNCEYEESEDGQVQRAVLTATKKL